MEFLQITLTGWVALSIALSMAFLAGIMFVLGTERFHYIWGFFCIAIAVWASGFYMVTLSSDPMSARFWWQVSYIGTILNPFLYAHFTLEFTRNRYYERFKYYLLSILYFIAGAFLYLDLESHLIVDRVTFLFGELYYDTPPGSLYMYFMSLFLVLICWSLYLIQREYVVRREDTLFRRRALYFFIASLLAYIGGSMNFLPIYGIEVPPVTNFAVAFGAMFIAYAILRYQLFNVRIVAAQFLTLTLSIFVLIQLIVSPTSQERMFSGLILAITSIVGIYLIRSVKREVEQRETIEKQEKELELVNQQQESLLHFISHEIKGYLAKSEAAFAAIVEGDYGAVSDPLKEMAQLALGETRKGVDTVMGILNASNLKKGTVALEKKPFDLKHAVLTVVDDLKPAAKERNISLHELFAPTGTLEIVGDEDKIRQHVIRNLIDNAIKYTPPGGSVDIAIGTRDGFARFETRDSGVGITAEDMARLFTEGGRGKDSIKINVHSTGYGLFIAKQIVKAHDGNIWAESKGEGKGSTFIAELPLSR